MKLARLALAAALAGCATFAAAQKVQLVVYTALEKEQIASYQEAFSKSVPDVDLKWVRDSTGTITAKLFAERDNPQADLVLGLAASSLAALDQKGMLLGYKPMNYDALMGVYRDRKNPPTWVGMDVWGAAICFNAAEAAKLGIPKPETWKDLLKPAFKGHIVMPNPTVSGTGFSHVTGWLSLWGDKGGSNDGWKFMDGLHENVSVYTNSGSRPCHMASKGEAVVGITFEYRANANKAGGAPIDLVFPQEGLGWDLEAVGILKSSKKLDAAKKLADWASSKDAMALYARNYAITAQPGVAPPLPYLPKDYEARLVKMDFSWAAANRDRILAEWAQRYSAKAEKR